MARPREFSEDLAVDKAMQLFWARGYQAASLNELLGAMELSRSSFYDTFGTKRGVLLEALRRYADSAMAGLMEPLLRPRAGRAEIEEAFRRALQHAASEAGARGCLINNCLTEVGPLDPEVLRAVAAVRAELESALRRAVRRGQRAGAIASREPPRALARFLLNTLSGLNLGAKARPGRAALDDVVRVALRALD